MEQRNFKPGEYNLEAMTLVNADGDSVAIEDICVNFRMYESIYNKFVSADISIVDGVNLLKNYKICGQEYVRISIRQKEDDGTESEAKYSIDKTFRVYKVLNNQRVDDKTQSYVLKLCEPRLFYLQKQRISQTWTGSWSEIALGTMQQFGSMKTPEIDFWEESKPSNVQFICPNWTVNRFLDYAIANSDAGVQAGWKNGFFLFQTLNGGFRFMSIDEMVKREHGQVFEYRPKTASLDSLDAPINVPGIGLNTTILAYEKPQLCDTLRAQTSGAYSATMRAYDPIRKIEDIIHYDLDETMGRGEHVGGYPMVRLNDEEVILRANNQVDRYRPSTHDQLDADAAPNRAYGSVVIKDYTTRHSFGNSSDAFANEPFIGIKNEDSGRLERRALLEMLQQKTIKMTVPLRTDLSVGSKINLSIPEPEVKRPGGKIENELEEGGYLVTDICVDADPNKYTGFLHIEAVKESFGADITSYRPLADTDKGELI